MAHLPRSDAARARAIKRHLWGAPQRFVATCPLGVETLLAAEVAALEGVAGVSVRPGGAVFDAPFDTVYAALLRLRLAESLRVVLIDSAAAGTFPMLFDQLTRVRWSLWLPERCAVTARVVSRRSRLRDAPGLERALLSALRRQSLDPHAADGPPMTLHLRLEHDRAAVALDLGGPLYRRAGDKWVSRTTIRESTAAALVRFAAERRDDGLAADLVLDPFCGSGTLLAESLELALGLAAGRRRRPPFEASPAWSAGRFRHEQRAAATDGAAPPAAHLGSDADPAAVLVARRNLEAAGLLEHAELEVRRAQELDLDAIAQGQRASRPLLLSNPPYGRAAAALGASPDELLLGVLRRARGWRFALLFPDPGALAQQPGIDVEQRLPMVTGGLRNALILGSVR
jgi:23S rRNA G2445 N2-methylase RlmL